MRDNYIFGLGAIICLTSLEGVALMQGIDGAYFAPIMTIIGGIVGALLGVTVGTVKKVTEDVQDQEKEN